jgi:2-polyprenyl-3-methyl-5-hydroxy-6-metoxy-1,4-benzoquinol methylase
MTGRFRNGDVRVRSAPDCFLCGGRGRTLYGGLRDGMFQVQGVWALLRCPACSFVWLDPRPVVEDIGLLHTAYHTHAMLVEPERPPRVKRDAAKRAVLAAGFGYRQPGVSPGWLLLGHVLARLDPIRDLVGAPVRWLAASGRGTVLDVGAGSGGFLAQMRSLGWDVRGIEPDAAAVEVARQNGLEVTCATLEEAQFSEGGFDVVTMGHVIEHLPNPIETLRECARVLKPGGRLVVVTPNASSLGRRLLGSYWRGLEVPRHLQLFSPSTLRRLVERTGLRVSAMRTTANSARWMLVCSRQFRRHGALPGGVPGPASRVDRFAALGFWALERALATFGPFGEEVVMVATKG